MGFPLPFIPLPCFTEFSFVSNALFPIPQPQITLFIPFFSFSAIVKPLPFQNKGAFLIARLLVSLFMLRRVEKSLDYVSSEGLAQIFPFGSSPSRNADNELPAAIPAFLFPSSTSGL